VKALAIGRVRRRAQRRTDFHLDRIRREAVETQDAHGAAIRMAAILHRQAENIAIQEWRSSRAGAAHVAPDGVARMCVPRPLQPFCPGGMKRPHPVLTIGPAAVKQPPPAVVVDRRRINRRNIQRDPRDHLPPIRKIDGTI